MNAKIVLPVCPVHAQYMYLLLKNNLVDKVKFWWPICGKDQ